ncbi:hypothetical protein M23134_08166 [Microscilla marina ATCC 23134]|uniref:Uncharacterized protein n=1 Tax=Microscilla marina ATCC 23134 TaxID=313606 RepID=A1ZH69_MICM2|nr:hypothetical protein M23134_08166 [Microscilla marina ATCC 23134]
MAVNANLLFILYKRCQWGANLGFFVAKTKMKVKGREKLKQSNLKYKCQARLIFIKSNCKYLI